jgi:hypothetical protein
MEEDGVNMDNWKQFQGTQLGSLLSGIYGAKKTQISYPKPKIRRDQPKGKWLPLGNEISASDPRRTTRRKVNVNAPRVGQRNQHEISLIDCVPKRRGEVAIQEELETMRMQKQHFRPAFIRPRGDAETERLSQVFGHKGGVCLPEELTAPVTDTPLEILKRKEKMEEMARRYKKTPIPVKAVSMQENMANQITDEIDERVDYLEVMKGLGGISKAEAKKLEGEIKVRVRELNNLEQGV